ncbi:tyrosine-protein kinase Srms [Pelodytes ibericus]
MNELFSGRSFLKEHLSWFSCIWNKLWPPAENHWVPNVVAVPSLTESQPNVDMLTVLYDFSARSTEELSVQQGEDICKISDEGEYVKAKKLTGNMEIGLVPANYVTFFGFSDRPMPIAEPSYIEVKSRLEAEQLLLTFPNKHGSYLIRPSDSNTGQYSLSVCKDKKVKHFRINMNNQGEFYLQEGRVFSTIHQLIRFHKTNWKLLKVPLLQPCVQQDSLTLDSWERPRSEFKMLKKLGEGFFGEVWEGLWNNKERVAIKTFKKENVVQSDFEKEIDALKHLSHPNLIQLLAVCSFGEPVYIVTELMTKGNLNEYLKGEEFEEFHYTSYMHIICQVAEGMAYLEMQHVVHRDLATRNVLVGDNLVCKIADFGLARLLKDDLYSPEKNQAIPVKWTAPEALTHAKYSTKSDVWSFGILMYEVFTYGEQPYKGMTNREVVNQILDGYRLPQPSLCNLDVYKLMLECWNDKAQHRPTFHDLVLKLSGLY